MNPVINPSRCLRRSAAGVRAGVGRGAAVTVLRVDTIIMAKQSGYIYYVIILYTIMYIT